jgi:tetraacyldisaccharide 4'-kinase
VIKTRRGSDVHVHAGPVPRPLGLLAEPIYRAVIGHRNRRFDAGRGVVRFDRVVISVGNLSVGGTGKTPMVMQLVRWLLDAGHRPVIAMRGYGKGGESDEAASYRRAFPDVPIVAQANRTLGLIQQFGREYDERALASEGHEGAGIVEGESDCIVLDDGFQHRQIGRDMDIVLIDATRSPFADRLLPAGWLREPVGSLERVGEAGSIVITHAESAASADVTALHEAIKGMRARGAEVVARHAWSDLEVHEPDGQIDVQHPVGWLAGKRVVAVCAIGNPGVFLEQVRAAAGAEGGGLLADEIVLRDHDPYTDETVARILRAAVEARAQAIVTTDKDWSKLKRVCTWPTTWPCPVARPRLAIAFDRGGEELRRRVLDVVAAGAPE